MHRNVYIVLGVLYLYAGITTTGKTHVIAKKTEILQELLEFVHFKQWHSVLVITDDSPNSVGLSNIMSSGYIYNSILIVKEDNFESRVRGYLSTTPIVSCIIVWCKLSCLQSTIPKGDLVHQKFHWLLVYENSRGLVNDSELLSNYIRFDSNIHVMMPDRNNTLLLRKLRYSKSSKGNITFEGVSSFNSLSLGGITLRAGVLHYPPVSHVEYTGGRLIVKSFRNDILLAMAQHLNFKFDPVFCNLTKTQAWACLIQMLWKEEIDVTGTFMPLTPPNSVNLSYSVHVFDTSVTLILRNIKYESLLDAKSSSVYSKPFSNKVAISTVLLLVFCILLIFFATYRRFLPLYHFPAVYLWYQWINKYIGEYLNTVLYQGGNNEDDNSATKKILVITTTLFLFIIISTYSGTLTSHFAADRYHMPFHTLNDLVSDGRFTFGAREGSPLDYIAKNLQVEGFKEMRQRGMYRAFATFDDCFHQVLMQDFVMFCVTDFCIDLDCNYLILQTTYFSFDIAIQFSKHSPYVEFFSRSILHLRSVGILSKLTKPVYRTKRLECDIDDTEYKAVKLKQSRLAFMILLYGILTAVSVLICEISLNKIIKRL